jgi:cytochrome oxidase assembly protein ShyY1
VAPELRDWFSRPLLGLHVLALVAVAVCVLMGLWQLGVYGAKHEDEAAAQLKAPPVELLNVWGPDDAFTAELVNKRVRIHGRIERPEIFTIKRPDGQSWYAATVRVQGTASSIVVVLGHAPDSPPADWNLPRREEFTAILRPPEPTGDLSMAERVNESSGDLFSGYALADDPMFTRIVKPVKPPAPDVSWTVGLRNLAYALQWWVFGLFAAFMWWRMATEALAARHDPHPRDGLPG